MTDIYAFCLFSGVLLGAVALGEGLRARARWSPESSRRAVHLVAGLATAASPLLFSGPALIYVLAAAFMGVNILASRRRLLPGMHGIERASLGTVTFPLALLFALVLCWTLDPARVFVLQVAFAVLALADPAASFVGTRLHSPRPYLVAGEMKSVAGSAAFGVIAAVCTAAVLAVIRPHGFGGSEIVASALGVAFVATLAEALGRRGWDNVLIVLAVIVVVSAIQSGVATLGSVVLGTAVASVFATIAYRLHALDLSGAFAAAVLAWLVVAVGGSAWVAPAFTFFGLSSALSAVGLSRKASSAALAQKGSRRDAGQVFANGGMAGAMLATFVWVPDSVFFLAFVGAFAAAAADTWGTELGTLVRGRTRLLAVGRNVAPGTSGGMSIAGTLGAVLGAATVGASAAAFVPSGFGSRGSVIAVVVAGAVAAAFVDSVLGATIQARYWLPGGSLTERSSSNGADLPLAAGFRIVDNDLVNLASTVVGGLIPIVVFA